MPSRFFGNVWIRVENFEQFSRGLAEMIKAIRTKNFGWYASDNLFTFDRNLSFIGDSRLMDAYKRNTEGDTLAQGILWRTAVVAWAAQHGMRLAGDFVECGAYKGTTAKIVCDYVDFQSSQKSFYLYDLFELDEAVIKHAMPDVTPDLYEKVVGRFSSLPKVKVIKGFIPHSFSKAAPDKIAFMHIDLNHVDPEIAALDHLFERMTPGAILVLDDYGQLKYHEQQRAEHQWFNERGYTVMELPTGQGIVVR